MPTKPFILEDHVLPMLQKLLDEGDDAEEFDRVVEILIDEFGKHKVRQWFDLLDNEVIID